ncbi:MAG TPA: four helix bundle protein [Chthoniobacteraceae bacterium]|jgi:four helix bundle protein
MFSHEKLIVHQKAIAFVAWTQPLIESLPKVSVRDQLDRASTSIPLNLAEGNVKFSAADRARYLQTAHGSTVECAACLDVAIARKLLPESVTAEGKALLEEIARMLAGLLSRLGYRFDQETARIREEGGLG